MPLGVCNTCHRGFILEIQPEGEAPDCPGCGELLEMQRVGKFQDLPRVPLALLAHGVHHESFRLPGECGGRLTGVQREAVVA